jgi:hypothetical protein
MDALQNRVREIVAAHLQTSLEPQADHQPISQQLSIPADVVAAMAGKVLANFGLKIPTDLKGALISVKTLVDLIRGSQVPAAPDPATPASPQTGIAGRAVSFLKTLMAKREWIYWLVFAVVVPYLALQNSKERLARVEHVLDETVPAVKLVTRSDLKAWAVQFADGKEQPLDSYGVAVMTWADHQKNPKTLERPNVKLVEADFPVVVFFNASGFDASGDPAIVRRGKDGSTIYALAKIPTPVAAATPLRSGSFRIWTKDGQTKDLTEEEWYVVYMGLDKQDPKADPKAEPKQEPKAELKTGLTGQIVQVGGVPAVQPLKADLYVFQGEVPVAPSPDKLQVPAIQTLKGVSEFKVSLAPGTYTLAIDVGGKLYGNAANQERWPTVGADGLTEYEFRFQAR